MADTLQIFAVDAWLSEVCARTCLKGQIGSLAAMTAAAIRKTLLDQTGSMAAFAYVKVPTRDTALSGRLEAAGFSVVDTGITLQWGGRTAPPMPADIVVRTAAPHDHAAIIDLASTSFSLSRFHLDPLFPRPLADAIKRDWIANYCRGRRGNGLYVGLADGRPAGFLAVLAGQDADGPWSAIDLVAVGEAFRGRGLGRALVDRFVADWHGKARLRVGTQAANTTSLGLYEGAGFRVVESAFSLHAHVREGQIVTC